jgi:hypothetical protein
MRDDLLKEQLMSYARTAADEAVQPDAAAIHRRARRRYRRLAALTVTAVLLVVGDGVGLGLRLGNGTPTVGQPPPVPTLTRPAPVPSTATTRPPATGTTAPTGTTRAAAVTGRLPATFVGDLGGRVAVVSTSTGKVVRALTGSQPSGPAGYAVGITPDRSTVYFSLSGPEGCRQRGIWRVPSGGGQPVRVVADDNAGGQIKFSADGSRFAHASVPCPDGGEGGDVVVREADGTLVRRFGAPAAGSDLTIGQVSLGPDGRSVAVPVRLVLDAVGVRVLDVARTDAFDKGRLVKSPDPGCTPVAADFHPQTGRLAAFEGCRSNGLLVGSPSRYRLVYLDLASGDLRSRSISFDSTGGDLHVSTMDFDQSGRHLPYTVTSGDPRAGTGTWRSSGGARPVRVHDDHQTTTGQHLATLSPSW